MSLIKCDHCGHDMSTAAYSCRECGKRNKHKSTLKCPECGKENEDTSIACSNCGCPAHHLTVKCPSCDTLVTPAYVEECPKCGTNLSFFGRHPTATAVGSVAIIVSFFVFIIMIISW